MVGATRVDPADATPKEVSYQVYSLSLGTISSQSYSVDNEFNAKPAVIYMTAQQGLYNLKLTPADNSSASASSINLNCIYVDTTVPTRTLTAPNSTTCMRGNIGDNLTVTWYATDQPNTSENVTIFADLSTDGGNNYPTTLISGVSYRQGTRTFIYTLSAPINSSVCKVRLKAVDRAGNMSVPEYISSDLFSIITTVPTVSGITPNDGPTWNSGEGKTIGATLQANGTGISYKIDLYVGGVLNSTITSDYISTHLTTVSPGVYTLAYPWTVTGSVNSTTCYFKITARDCAGNTASADSPTFTIKSTALPTCTIYTPQTGSTKYAGKSDNITFHLDDNINANVTCDFWFTSSYTENCTTCWTENPGTAAFPLGDNYFTWNVYSVTSDNCKIKIICTDSAGNTASFLSNTFKVRNDTQRPVITMCPLPSSSFPVGSTVSITWTASDQPDTTARLQYDIYLSTNNGSTFPTLVASLSNQQQCATCSCSYSWAVSDNVSSTCKLMIKATDPAGNDKESLPSGSFAITAAANPVQTGSVTLRAGWNLMSLPLIPTNTDIANILASVMPNVISVQYYQDATTGFIDYTPGAEGNTLTTMVDGKAYWIKMYAGGPYTLTFQGRKSNTGLGPCTPTYPSSSTTFPIGWAMVGFKSSVNQTKEVYLEGICGTDYSTVSGYDPTTTDLWFDLGCTDNMTPGKGYWVKFLKAYAFEPGCQ
jgi:hypothetical protein